MFSEGKSTISRAVADKYVLLPWRQVVPFDTFFEAARAVEDVLRELVGAGGPTCTDGELAGLLAERGVNIARRSSPLRRVF